METLTKLANCGIIPVVVTDRAEDAVPVANALLAGGINVMEITLRTPEALDAILQVAKNCPDMLVGAGTVLSTQQCKDSINAGAKFIVSPGLDTSVANICITDKIPIVPGCVTPTEITQALSLGLDIVKFFPSNVFGGINAIKALSAPFQNVKFIPTGGINSGNLAEYISAPFIHAVGGSWICTQSDIVNSRFDKITSLCRDAKVIIDKARLKNI